MISVQIVDYPHIMCESALYLLTKAKLLVCLWRRRFLYEAHEAVRDKKAVRELIKIHGVLWIGNHDRVVVGQGQEHAAGDCVAVYGADRWHSEC